MNSNRTNKYLANIINKFGNVFIKEFIELTNYNQGELAQSVVSFNIIDILYLRSKKINIENLQEHIYITIDPKGFKKNDKYANETIGYEKFLTFLKFVRKFHYYVDDYWLNENKHTFVFNIPKLYKKSYKKFLISKYSEMYTKEQLKELGYKPNLIIAGINHTNWIYLVLTKNEKAIKVLEKYIQEKFDTDSLPENPDEYDLPWEISEEVINFEYISKEESIAIKKIRKLQ